MGTRRWKRARRAERKLLLKSYCEVCRATENLCYDHSHITGEFRGTLCKRCNSAIGLLDEDLQRLGQAIKYLRGRNGKGSEH